MKIFHVFQEHCALTFLTVSDVMTSHCIVFRVQGRSLFLFGSF
nr:MAG TPA: hypothetical protein [Caudoviricetes sp.]